MNNRLDSLRSWRYCKRPRNKVLAAEPTSERRSREENGERDSESLSPFSPILPHSPRRRMGRGTLSPSPHSPRGFAARLSAPPPKLYFAGAYNTASYAGYRLENTLKQKLLKRDSLFYTGITEIIEQYKPISVNCAALSKEGETFSKSIGHCRP